MKAGRSGGTPPGQYPKRPLALETTVAPPLAYHPLQEVKGDDATYRKETDDGPVGGTDYPPTCIQYIRKV